MIKKILTILSLTAVIAVVSLTQVKEAKADYASKEGSGLWLLMHGSIWVYGATDWDSSNISAAIGTSPGYPYWFGVGSYCSGGINPGWSPGTWDYINGGLIVDDWVCLGGTNTRGNVAIWD